MNTNKIHEDLKSKGYKKSLLRLEVIDYILASKKPVTVKNILEYLVSKDLFPNKTTVYRELEILVKESVVNQITNGDNLNLYEITSENLGHHHHLFCTSCNSVECVKIPENFSSIEAEVEAKSNFQIKQHIMEFFGICGNCNQNFA